MKIFGSYGVTNDVMKLLLAQTSFGAQGFDNCGYALGPDSSGGFSNSDLDLTFVNGRACPTGVSTVGANFAGGVTPASLIDAGTGVSLIENTNLRPEEPVVPGLKPYRQHEIVAGWDYQINKDWAFEARYDRRRLDHIIEDASLADPSAFEIYNVVNPGQGVNKTLNGYASYLTSLGDAYGPGTAAFNGNPATPFGTCTGCPNNPHGDPQLRWSGIAVDEDTEQGFDRNVQLHLEPAVGQLCRPHHHRPDRFDRTQLARHQPFVRRAVLLFPSQWQVQCWASADRPSKRVQGLRVLHDALEGRL